MNPKVSVIIPAYNHAHYVLDAINSVLNQTFQDFEIILCDDSSTDETYSIALSVSDSRLNVFRFDENQGAAIATNFCISKSRGEYIALLNSDDMWTQDKLAKQVDFLDSNLDVGAVFSNATFIDQDGNNLNKESVGSYFDIFKQSNRSQIDWLRRFFYQGNCLCHPSVLMRAECYRVVGDYNNLFRQLPDFEMWIRLVKKFPIHVMDASLVKFRILKNERNVSSATPINEKRSKAELMVILKDFFEDMDIRGLQDVFRDEFDFEIVEVSAAMRAYVGFALINSHSVFKGVGQIVGYQLLFYALEEIKNKKIFIDGVLVDFRYLQNIAGEIELFSSENKSFSIDNIPFKIAAIGLLKRIFYKIKRTI